MTMASHQKYVDSKATNHTEEESYVETKCGCGSCRPSCLQRINNPKILCLCLCLYTFVQGFAVNGINNVNTTSYERRFQLASSQVGWISSSFDISAAIFGVVIGFYGSRRHKARILTVAFFIASLGSLCMFLPHFITGLYQWGQQRNDICSASPGLPESCDKEDTGLQKYLAMLIIGQMMHGIGGSTLITVGYSLMDDSVPAVSAPLYIALIGLCQALGPMVGYIVGGALLNVYVDVPQVSRENWELTPDDPRWVGGWWIGFFMSSILMFLLALPFLFFGAELPTAKRVRETRISEAHADDNMSPVRHTGEAIKFKEFPRAALRLLQNPAFICITLSSATSGLVTISLATFLPKYIQNMFGLTAANAAMLAGAIIIPGLVLGQLLGGVVLRRGKFRVKATIRYIIIVVAIGLMTKCAFFITCDNNKLVGWNMPYANRSDRGKLLSTCNADCNCATDIYKQICDTNGNKYFSPCLAGCSTKTNPKVYADCRCISDMPSNISSVSIDNCKSAACNRQFIIFMIIVFLGALIGGSSLTPILMVVLRCTQENDRTLALGFMNFIGRVFGSIPGPIIYGAAIDSTCAIWGNSCGNRTSCWIYSTTDMGKYLAILGLSFTALTLFFDCLAYKLYRPPKEKDSSTNDTNTTTTAHMEIYTTENNDTKI